MALPGNVNTVTVTGTYMDMSGTPLTGTVTFRPSVGRLRDPDADVIITDFPFVVTLDVSGSFSIELPATDDPDLIPSPWSYQVTENLNDHRESFFIEVPLSTPGGTIDMADIEKAVKVPAVITYASRSEFLTHLADTITVHGIADTSLLETKSGAQAKATAAGTQAINAAAVAAAALYARKDRNPINIKDYGAVGDGVADDTAAIQAAIDAAIGGGPAAGVSAVRQVIRSVFAPPGVYRLTSKLKVYSVAGLHFYGTGDSSMFYADAAGMDYVIDINGAYRSLFESFSVSGSATATVTTAVGLNWDSAVSMRSTTQTELRRITVRNLKYVGGIGIGSESGSVQVDMIHITNCRVFGGNFTMGSPDATYWQWGMRSGSASTSGNQIGHWYNQSSMVGNRKNFFINNVMASIIQADLGYAEDADVWHVGLNSLRVIGVRSEHSRRFYDQAGGSSYLAQASLQDVLFSDVSMNADKYFVRFTYGGTYLLDGVRCAQNSAVVDPMVRIDTGFSTRPVTVTAINCRSANTVSGLFSVSNNTPAILTVSGYGQVNTSTQDVTHVALWTKEVNDTDVAHKPTFTGGTQLVGGVLHTGWEDEGSPFATGEYVANRRMLDGTATAEASQVLSLTFFRATKTETIASLAVATTATAASGLTLIRYGVYEEASNGDLTLIASTVNDTALLASTYTKYSKALSAPWSKVAGKRYAIALLQVGTTPATTYSWTSHAANTAGTFFAATPRLTGSLAAQADLPASVPVGSIAATRRSVFFEMSV